MKLSGILISSVLLLGIAGVADAAGKTCKLDIAGNDLMQYDKKELKVAADCAQVEVTLKHTGKLPANTMGHTWVLSKTSDMAALTAAGVTAGLPNAYVPAGDKRVLAATKKVVGGGESTTVTFSTAALKKGEDYSYFCSFPGHSALMKGKFIIG